MEHLLCIDYNYEVEQLLYYKIVGASKRVCLGCREGVVCPNQVCRMLSYFGEEGKRDTFGIGKEK